VLIVRFARLSALTRTTSLGIERAFQS